MEAEATENQNEAISGAPPHSAAVSSADAAVPVPPAAPIVQPAVPIGPPAAPVVQPAAPIAPPAADSDHRPRPNRFFVQNLSSNDARSTRDTSSHYHSLDLPADCASEELPPQFVVFDVNFNARGLCMAMYRLAIYPGNPNLLVANRAYLTPTELYR